MKNLYRVLAVVLALSCSQAALAHEEKNPVGKFILGFDQVDDVNNLESVGSPFTRALKLEYNKMANILHNAGYDALARVFATKGVESAKGNLVPLEKITEWNKTFMDTNTFAVEHARLNKLLDAGARNLSPVNAAIAQGSFDCWLMLDSAFPAPAPKDAPAQTADNKTAPKAPVKAETKTETKSSEYVSPLPDFTNCKKRYMEATAQIESHLKIPSDAQATPTAASLAASMAERQNQKAQQSIKSTETYTVYFDSGSSALDATDMAIIEQASKQFLRAGAKTMTITGFTDTKGSASANKKLSKNRSNAVRDFMMNYSVPANAIVIEAEGESALAVDTRDGRSEEKNRRVEITMQ